LSVPSTRAPLSTLLAGLGSVEVPDDAWFDPMIGSSMFTGLQASDVALLYDPTAGDGVVALDTETPSVTDPFRIKCVTASWWSGSLMYTVLLDPLRSGRDHAAVKGIIARCRRLVLHNAPFDIPGLYHAGLLDLADIKKVDDTLVLARLALPDTLTRKSLAALSTSMLGLPELSGGMTLAFKANGYKTIEAGYRGMDINVPAYRFGAMSDTAVTLTLYPKLIEACRQQLTNHPFRSHGLGSTAEADDRIEWVQVVNRVMLRRNAVGLAYDDEYLWRYRNEVAEEQESAAAALTAADIRPGNGLDLVTRLDQRGELPGGWLRTKTGKLSSAKDHVALLTHPLADAHRTHAHTDKILGYLEKCAVKAEVTGRIHPQCSVLGASATGRMSYSDPELQQFPDAARPIIRDDGQGLTSIDWSQIEPVTLANMAGDLDFLAPYERGEDLYALPMRAAGISRKMAKVVLLAAMYGQGIASLARDISQSEESAAQIRRQLFSAMPTAARFMSRINEVAEAHGMVCTAAGRILPVPVDLKRDRVMAHKAVNYVVQGSACDVLMDAIVRCEAAGLGDHIQIPLHDELVVDTPAAEAVREIMATPPSFLSAWAGRIPVLRCDSADMGHAWTKPD
jgi:DNA polymerase-1